MAESDIIDAIYSCMSQEEHEHPSQSSPDGQTRPLSADTFIPRTPYDTKEASEIADEIDRRLEQPENLSPNVIYSMVFTLNQCTLHLIPFERKDLADDLRVNFQKGLQAMMRSTRYNPQEHDGLRHDLYQGYLNQLNIRQSLTPDAPGDTPTP